MRFHFHTARIVALTGILMFPVLAHGDPRNELTPAQYRIRQILLEPSPGQSQDASVYARALDVLNRAKNGEDFSALARRYSQEPGADRTGGDLGFFAANQMVRPFSEAVFSMKPGEIRGPVKTPFGYHIVKLLEIRGSKRHAQHILLTLSPDRADSAATLALLRKIRRQLVRGVSFRELSDRYNTLPELRETEGYMVWQKPEDMLDDFRRAVIGMKPGDISAPFVSIIGYHIIQVDSINYNPDVLLQGFPQNIERRLRERGAR